ncbi:MAG: CDP-alcohol phosphatidyltransferase family protein [Myxococcota bacterium]
MIRHFLNPPNWFTSASIFCSVYAMALVLATPQVDPATLSRACVLVIFGGIFDLLDGRVARMTNRFTEFGVQLDSIADVLGFGLAPALIAWVWALKDLGPVGVGVTFWYVLCAAFRLARFNVAAQEHDWPLDGHTRASPPRWPAARWSPSCGLQRLPRRLDASRPPPWPASSPSSAS